MTFPDSSARQARPRNLNPHNQLPINMIFKPIAVFAAPSAQTIELGYPQNGANLYSVSDTFCKVKKNTSLYMPANAKTMLPTLGNIAPSIPKIPDKCRARTSTPDIQHRYP
ncbi:hypothetical protein BDR07DRAFT_123297 [Suillus spraguei]|nr:hypothetical protein BDR07DRAFT_123297 [Suillus spraguei]